ncbi:flagellar protein FlgN [Lentibacillus saliphilus]|uniref:flagellar protein FlgN n=1 Tax=Lentibacillus saliphilus TaxID=2737028 RepID=UPI001C30F605|nr:flagellar protein FlgN [Lentibacillus saliphilus]
MSVTAIVTSIEDLTEIHHEMLDNSNQKTEALKLGNTDDLQRVLVKERKLARKLEQAEQRRQTIVNEWFASHAVNEEATLTYLLDTLSGHEKMLVEQSSVELIEKMSALKQQEQLNMALLQQSMQYVQLSLDMIQPSISTMNYGHKADASVNDRSVFDSKA